ncbi:MAG: hypothetical protein ACK5YO_11220, partial [Planctomyces sp.]
MGSAQTNESGTLADALTVSITSTSGPVTIENRVIAQNAVTVGGTGLSVLAGGQLKTTAANAEIRLIGTGSIFVESSVQADAELLAPGQIQASGLVH